jgi:hypothetical protein
MRSGVVSRGLYGAWLVKAVRFVDHHIFTSSHLEQAARESAAGAARRKGRGKGKSKSMKTKPQRSPVGRLQRQTSREVSEV